MSSKVSNPLFDDDDSDGEDIFQAMKTPQSPRLPYVTLEEKNFLKTLDQDDKSDILTEFNDNKKSVTTSESTSIPTVEPLDWEKEKIDLMVKLETERKKYDSIQEINSNLKKDMNSMEMEVNTLKNELESAKEMIRDKAVFEIQWKSQNDSLQKLLEEKQEELNTLQFKSVSMDSEMILRNDTLQSELETSLNLNKEIEHEKSMLNDKLNKLETEYNEVKVRVDEQEGSLLDLKLGLSQKDEKIKRLTKQISAELGPDENIHKLKDRVTQLENDLVMKTETIDNLTEKAALASEVEKKDDEIKQQKENIRKFKMRVESLERDSLSNSEQITSLTGKMEMQQKELVKKTSTLRELQQDVSNRQISVTSLPSDQIAYPPKDKSQTVQNTILVPMDNISQSKDVSPNTAKRTTVIVDKQTGKSMRAMTLEERKKNFTGSQENFLEDAPNPTRHSFNRTPSPNHPPIARTHSPDFLKSTSQPVSPELTEKTELDNNISESLPPSIFPGKISAGSTSNIPKGAKFDVKRTYSPQPRKRSNVDMNYCISCGKKVYDVERTIVDKLPYHKGCFKCSICKSTLHPGRHASYEGTIYCLNHFKQQFLGVGGRYPDQIKAN